MYFRSFIKLQETHEVSSARLGDPRQIIGSNVRQLGGGKDLRGFRATLCVDVG